MSSTEALKAVAELLPVRITCLFRLMDLAEQEITKAKESYPLQETILHAAFALLCPRMELFGSKTPDLYVAHVQEILTRVRNGVDTRPGTKAEVLAAMVETSFLAPLDEVGRNLTTRLFKEVLPDVECVEMGEVHEPWPGSLDESLAKCQRKLAVSDRRL